MEWLAQKFELSRGGSELNVRPMEGLRGFAVFLVFLVHYVTLVEPWINWQPAVLGLARALHTIGNAGVDLFFVLSGYLIYGSLISRKQEFTRFMARRVKRIYPAFLVVFAVYVVLSFLFKGESKIPDSPFFAILYLAENLLLLPGIFPVTPLITVAWSLSYEMFFYLAIPLVIALFNLRQRSPAWRTGFFVVAASGMALSAAAFGGPIRLVMFVSGILLHEAMEGNAVPSPPNALALFILVLGLSSTLIPARGTASSALAASILFCTFFVLCLACFRDTSGWLSRAFSCTPLRWLGNMSYSYYLVHGLALKAAFLALAFALPATNQFGWLFWALLPVMFALTLIPSAALFLAVEKPFSLTPDRAHIAVASKTVALKFEQR